TLTRVEDGYERWLGGSLKERPVTLVFAMGVLLALGFMYVNTTSELAPQEDQGIVFGVVKGPPYANIDYMDAYRKAIDEALVLDETHTRFIIIGQPTVNQGFVGDVLKPWDERKRTADALQPELQGRLGDIPGLQIFMFSPPALPGSTGGLPVQMAVYSTSGYPVVYQVMEKVKKAARDSGMFVVVDSDLAFDTAVLSIDIDRSKANELGVTMQSVGDTLALLLGGDYVNRFNLAGRAYPGIPQTPRGARLN
ncbi:efflux RND transporter permease subunit, partial [Nostoc sp. NIES-2111]